MPRSSTRVPFALLVALGMLAVVLWSSSASAAAALAPAHRSPGAPLMPDARMTLAQAPGSLQIAVRRTLGRSGATWTQRAELTASRRADYDEFGSAVAVSGDTAVIGEPFTNYSTGAAYVFVRSGGS